ncbi:MAG: thioredoxin-disulfide reductase [Candidatus Thorarchaeota archaeon]|nr:thioredoxin-disulfide reductase [Candidatus Thorarchaeota archaeon]
MSTDSEWDLIIVGAGPAGMTSAIYGARYGMKTLLLESKVAGGAQATSPGIENYPGFNFIPGMELAEKMKEQALKSGATIKEITEVSSISKDEATEEFTIVTKRGEYKAKAIVLAMGGEYRKLGVPGEKEYTGRGVSYCATCDGPLFRGKTVAVVGGGNTAVTEALYLSEIVGKTYLIHRRDELRAEKALQDQILASNVEILWDTVVKEIKGEQLVTHIVIENVKSGEQKELPTDGVFMALGIVPSSEVAKEFGVKVNGRGEIITDKKQATNIPGIYAAGDVTDTMKQVVVACGNGAIAADSAYEYVRDLKSKSSK